MRRDLQMRPLKSTLEIFLRERLVIVRGTHRFV